MYYLKSMSYLNQCECGNVLNVLYKERPCPKCGKRLADQLVPISPNKNINLTDLPDLISYTSKASSKHEREAGLAESDGRTYTYVNEETCEDGHHINEVMTENGYCLTSYCKFGYSGYYVKYDEINNLLVFIFAQRNGSTGWHEDGRFWIDQNKNIYFEGNSKKDHMCQKMAFKSRHKKLLHNMTHLNETEDGRFENFLDEIKKLFPELKTSTMVKLQGNKIISVNDFSTFTEFLCYHPKNIKKSGKKQQKIDELIKIPLPDMIDPPSGNLSTERIAILNRVSDENCVLRMFSYLPSTKTSKEEYRMYIDSKDVYACSKTGGEWIYQPILKKPESYSFYLLDYDKRIAANTRLQYFSEIISEISPEEQSMFIWAFLRYPLVEQIYKAGYKNVVNGIFSICKTQNTALENCLVNSFLAPMKGKNLFQKLGLNAYQLDRVNKSFVGMYRDKKKKYVKEHNIIAFIKNIMSENTIDYTMQYCTLASKEILEANLSIADLDNESFDRLFDFFEAFIKKINFKMYNGILGLEAKCNNGDYYQYQYILYRLVRILKQVNSIWGMKSMLSILDDLLKFSMTLEPYNFTNIYEDYVDTVKRLPDKSVFQPQIRSLDHVLGLHDIASSVYLLEKDEIERANWDKNVKKAVKWEYNDPDTDFIAVAPAEPSELALEGTVLGHCVKTYIPKVTDGITNVMFIRKKDEPKIPFFTVEIDNSNHIQQVHGQGNCNADTAPEILPFIDHWCKAKKLKKMSINKVR